MCCVQCYIVEKDGGNKIGFVFYGFFGCKIGFVDGYFYIDVNKQKGIIWDDKIFFEYFENFKKYIFGIKMVFGGFKKEKDRNDFIV